MAAEAAAGAALDIGLSREFGDGFLGLGQDRRTHDVEHEFEAHPRIAADRDGRTCEPHRLAAQRRCLGRDVLDEGCGDFLAQAFGHRQADIADAAKLDRIHRVLLYGRSRRRRWLAKG